MADFIRVVFGIIAVTVLGLAVRPIIDAAAKVPGEQDPRLRELWNRLGRVGGGGRWIGALERYLALIAFWIQRYEIIAGWLAFKLASKWEVWKNIVQVPKDPPADNSSLSDGQLSTLDWYTFRSQLGEYLLTRFWVGTLANIIVGAIGRYVGWHLLEFAKCIATFRTR